MDTRRIFAYLLLGLCIFMLLNSMQQQRQIAADQAKRNAERLERETAEREIKIAELKKRAEENPELALPDEPDRQHVVLGSMDASSGFSLMVFLDSRGAGIERIEVVERDKKGGFKYRSLQEEERVGYAGYLKLEMTEAGLIIGSVPPGSPAATAENVSDPASPGLKPGDRIVSWNGLEGDAALSKFDTYSGKWRPGDSVSLQIQRGDSPSQDYKLTLVDKPLDIVRAEDDFLKEQVQGNDPTLSCLTTLAKIDGLEIGTAQSSILGLENTVRGNWQVHQTSDELGDSVEFTLNITPFLKLQGIDAQLELVKKYSLAKPNPEAPSTSPDHWQYHVSMATTVRNLGEKEHRVAVRQDGLNGISLEGWWYPTKISPFFFSAAGARDIIVGDQTVPHSLTTTRVAVYHAINTPDAPDKELFGPANTEARRTLNYIGLDTQSFTAALVPDPIKPNALANLERGSARVINSVYADKTKLPVYKQQATNVGFWIETPTKTLAPKEEWTQNYQIFAGPKEPSLLAAYKLDDALEYGWHIIGFFAKRLGWILHFFYGLVGSFGIAIVMLTILVRSFMYPVSRKMALNAQKMQAVQPYTVKLRETFKEEPRKLMTAQQLLMKKAGVNQFAGCLPALIQLPIVMGLYRCVSVDVGLRQQPLIPGVDWCSNLAAPDMLANWHGWMPDFIAGRGTGFFGPYFNILPIITVALFIIQQKVLMPKATDEQTAMAQKMMMFMTVAMGVLFFRVPAGLCIYFISSSTWSLVERWIIRRNTPKGSNVEISELTVNDIIQTVNKMGTNNAAPAKSTKSPAGNSNRPKEKYSKPPETLADVFPGWFGKKQDDTSNANNASSKKDDRGGNNRGQSGNRKSKKPKAK